MWKKIVVILSIFIVNSYYTISQKDIETVIHLLNYISVDYSGAVENENIINEQEYAEQQEFSQQALQYMEGTNLIGESDRKVISIKIQQLIKLINDKVDNDAIVKLINSINGEIIEITGIQTSPKSWPSLSNGRRLYEQTCASCHGITGKGDGELGKSLDPLPSDFTDMEAMSQFSAYQALNTIRLGLPGTGMQAYSYYNETELWDLAFYVKSFGYQDADTNELRNVFNTISKHIDLSQLSNLNDEDLLKVIREVDAENPELQLSALRALVPFTFSRVNSIPIAIKGLQDALESYRNGDKKLARTHAITAYLDGVEPIESQLKIINSDAVIELEVKMFEVRNAIIKGVTYEELELIVGEAISALEEVNQLLQGQSFNYWLTFLIAASIMLREGLEAFLIIAVVISLIRSLDMKKALPWLHGGWIAAVLSGILGWYFSDLIIQFGGKNREIMEGLVSLFAVAVLMFVGFWLHNHSSAEKWKEFVEKKVGIHLHNDRMYGLAIFSFMIVFREVFEVILFLQAINLEAGPANKSAIGLGVITASILIAVIAYFFLKSTRKLPIRQLFQYSSLFIALLAVILLGKGIHSLQESGWISVSPISGPRIEWLGLYNTVQTVVGQLVLISIIVITYVVTSRKHKKPQPKG